MPNLLQIIKKAAIDAVEASSPAKVMYGTVVAVSPLSVRIEQRFTIPEEFLTLTKNVCDYEMEMTVGHTLEYAEGHTHEYEGRKTFAVHNGLRVGDRVMLLREQGGQNYIVLDKIGGEP